MRLAAVEADPHECQKPGRVADEPRVTAVVGRAGLARHEVGQTARPRGAPGSGRHDALQQRRHQKGFRRRHSLHGRLRAGRLHFLVAELDGPDAGNGREPDAAVRQRDVGARQIEWRDLERSQRHRRHRGQVTAQAQCPGHLDDARQAHRLRDPDGRGIERSLQRLPDAHAALVAVFVVARAPGLAAQLQRDRQIVHARGRGELRRAVARVERGEVHDRLEGRARLPAGEGGAVELAGEIIAPPDQGANLARRGLHRHQDDLQSPPGIPPAQTRQAGLDPVEAADGGGLRELL